MLLRNLLGIFSKEWAPRQTHQVGDVVLPRADWPQESGSAAVGFYFTCVQAGTSASAEPHWPTTRGTKVTDGSAVWICSDSGRNHGTAIYMQPGKLGGAAGSMILGNYFIGFDVAVYLVGAIGASVRDNTAEQIYKQAVVLSDTGLDGSSASAGVGATAGCSGVRVCANTFINVAAQSLKPPGIQHPVIALDAASGCFVTENAFVSPYSQASGCVRLGAVRTVSGSGGDVEINTGNLIHRPRIFGNNRATIPAILDPHDAASASLVVAPDAGWLSLPTMAADGTKGWGVEGKGRLFYDQGSDGLATFDGSRVWRYQKQ